MQVKAQLGSMLFFLALTLVFSLDCFTPVAADSQAMQCCGSMPCNHGSSQHDCCKAMRQSPVAMLGTSQDSLLASPTTAHRTTVPTAMVFSPAPPTFAHAVSGSPGLSDHAPPLDSFPSISVLRI